MWDPWLFAGVLTLSVTVSYYLVDNSCFKCLLRTHADFYLFLSFYVLGPWTYLGLSLSFICFFLFHVHLFHPSLLLWLICAVLHSSCAATAQSLTLSSLFLSCVSSYVSRDVAMTCTLYIHTFEGGCPSVCPLVLYGLLPSTTLCDQPLASHQQLDLTLLSPIPFDLVV
jgi:hypothetical protein